MDICTVGYLLAHVMAVVGWEVADILCKYDIDSSRWYEYGRRQW